MKKVLFPILALVLALGLALPMAVPVAAVDGVVTNYGFIPNSGEASVSKVNLVDGTAVARYYTAPRIGDEVDFEGNAAAANTVPPYAWRTSRIAMDAGGNAWVLNVGADKYLSGYVDNQNYPTGYNFGSYSTYVAANGLVGSIVRIQVDTEGLGSTSTHHDTDIKAFGSDDAVQVFPVGAIGEMPRAIAIDAEGNIWVGFYGGGKYFQKYSYDGMSLTLTAEGDAVTDNFTPYEAKIDKNGILWFSSRNANPTVSANNGIFYFDTAAPAAPTRINLGVNPYSILIDNGEEGDDVVVWATALDNNLYKIDTASGTPYTATSIPIASGAGLRGLGFDGTGKIWMAGSSSNRVYSYNPVGGAIETSAVIASVAVPVGVGMDAAGYMWTVCRDDNHPAGFIAKFDPTNVAGGFTQTPVGYRPYAYGEFIQAVPVTYDICGFKYADWDGDEIPLPGWTITLDKSVDTEWVEVDGSPQLTDENGLYCFEDLEAGDYRVSETLKGGWDLVSPSGNQYLLTLPDDASDCVEGPFYNFHNTPHLYCFDETAWASEGFLLGVAQHRFVPAPGNWFTYVDYITGSTVGDPEVYPLYAGQTHYAGDLQERR